MRRSDSNTLTKPSSWWRKLGISVAAALLTVGASYGQSVSATYTAGDIPTNYLTYSATCNGPATPLVVNIPPGSYVTSVNVAYSMSTAGGGYMSEQRSRIACTETGMEEATVASGSGNSAGTFAYNRSGLTIANGLSTSGTLTFQMRAWRTWEGTAGCNTLANKVNNNTWTVTVNYSPCLAPPAATTTIQQDCANGMFSVVVNLTSMGNATSVTIGSDYAGNPGGATVTTTGTTTLGPFADLSTVNITLVTNTACTVMLAPITFNCADYGKNALSFDGTNDRVNFSPPGSLNFSGTQITLEAWIYPTSWKPNTYQGCIINTEAGYNGYSLRCGNSGRLNLALGNGSTTFYELTSNANALVLNQWQHVAGTYDGATMRLYVNGSQISSSAQTFTIVASNSAVAIGDWTGGTPARTFPGKIDEVRIWNTTLSQATISSNMNTAYCGGEAGLRGYYKFDQGEANGNNAGVTTLTDLSGNGNNGTLQNFALNGTTSNWVQGQTNMGPCVTVTCPAPLNVAATNVTVNSVDLSWTNTSATLYEYEIRTMGTPGSGATGLTTSGTATSGSPATTVTGLLTGVTYQAYVRANCGAGEFSTWSSSSTFTPGLTQVGSGTATNPFFPIQSCYGYNYSQQLYLAGELAGQEYITKIKFKYVSGAAIADNWTTNWQVYLGNTDKTSFTTSTDWVPLASLQQVFTGSVYPVAGQWMEITLDTPFLWDGSSSIVVAVDENAPSYTCTANWQSFTASANRGILYYNDGTNPDPATPPTANISPTSTIAQIQFISGITPACFAPTATATIVPDCANNQFTIDVNLTNLSGATSVGISSDYAGNPGGNANVTAPGHTILGPFASLSTVNVTVTHNDDSNCNLALDPITFDCDDFGKNALSFDGGNDRVACGEAPSVSITGNAITMEAWIYPTAFRDQIFQGSIINKESNSGNGSIYCLRTGAGGRLEVALGGPVVNTPSSVLSLNTWQHVAATYDGSTIRIYVNGIQVHAGAHTGAITASPGFALNIGNSQAFPDRGFVGKIDEVRIWNTTLSATTINANKNIAYCGDEPGLAAYYQFDQGIADANNAGVTTLNDLSVNGNNGTLLNFALTGTTSNWVQGQMNMGDCVPIACPAPTALNASGITTSGANISWTNNGTATAWEIEYGPSGFTVGTGTVVAAGTNPFTLSGLTPTTTYHIYVRANCGVDGVSVSAGPISVTTLAPPPPANDLCANAIAIDCNTIVTGNTVFATGMNAPANCGDYTYDAFGRGVWYTVAGFDGPMSASLCGSTFDTQLWVGTGACGALTCVVGNDDGGELCPGNSTGGSFASWTGAAGTTYYIYVTGFSTASGDYVLSTSCGSTDPSCSENGLIFSFQTDGSPEETSWDLLDATGSFVILSGGPLPSGAPASNLQQYACVPDGCYQFRVNDSGADGMTTPVPGSANPVGGYTVTTQGTNTRIIDNSFNFVDGDASIVGEPFCLPMSTTDLIYTSCDKYFWKSGEYIVCNEVPEVSADYNGGGAAGADSGYDFWFFDPNGTYSYVRERRHNVSDNYANVGATRTCHMKINNWAVANHIPDGLKLNVRVRTVVNGVAGAYGPACRFVRDQALSACPPTILFDVPGFPQFYSCGVTRNFTTATAQRLYARPIAGASQYRFTFTNGETTFEPGGANPPIVRENTTYYINLGWSASVAPPLLPGQTYSVVVQAKVGGVWCVAGEPCLVTINNMAVGGQQNAAIDTQASALNLWPNPNKGDELFMTLSIADPFINNVNLDIYDLSGKRMIARTVGVQDGIVNTAIALNGDLVAGMYMVHITAGDEVFTQRVVIQP